MCVRLFSLVLIKFFLQIWPSEVMSQIHRHRHHRQFWTLRRYHVPHWCNGPTNWRKRAQSTREWCHRRPQPFRCTFGARQFRDCCHVRAAANCHRPCSNQRLSTRIHRVPFSPPDPTRWTMILWKHSCTAKIPWTARMVRRRWCRQCQQWTQWPQCPQCHWK